MNNHIRETLHAYANSPMFKFDPFQTKSPDRDEKRNLTKLQLVGEAESHGESREVTKRFDLESGTYFIVPFCRFSGHGVEFILRVMGEKDPVANKTGW